MSDDEYEDHAATIAALRQQVETLEDQKRDLVTFLMGELELSEHRTARLRMVLAATATT